jgi:CotH kinase protein
MITKDETTRLREISMGALVLVAGVAIGLLLRSVRPAQDAPWAITADETTLVTPTQGPMARSPIVPPEPENDLPTLYIDLKPKAAARLQAVRDRAFARGQIIQEADDLVPATIRTDGKEVKARVRIKGDFLDHLQGDKWSLRIELKGDKLFGMSRMSIQSPVARGYLWEWLILNAARREGLLAPRNMFVNVVVNNNPTGIYYLEEHFAKELLESQGRREGPIVRYVEDAYWAEFFQHKSKQGTTSGPTSIEPSQYVTSADIAAFGEKRLAQSENLARQLGQALAQLRAIQQKMMSQRNKIPAEELARLEAAIQTKGTTIDEVLDTRSAADMHALLCLFRSNHGLVWPNRRFYHNPVTDRLEPIVYDTLAGTPSASRDPIGMATWTTREFLKNPSYYNRLFERLGELSSPAYIDELFAEYEPDLRRYAALLRDEGMDVPQTDVDAIKNQLYDQQVFLRELLRPIEGANFDCRLESDEFSEDQSKGMLEVEAWATTGIPVVVTGFRFGNDRLVSAKKNLAPGGPAVSFIKGNRDAVVLPNDGRHVVFRFPIDERLATLGTIEEMKAARKKGEDPDQSVNLSLAAEYHYIGANEPKTEQLSIRRFGSAWRQEGGRPDPPTLEDALARHAFLSYDPDSDELSVRAGVWEVNGDLVVPDGYPLRVRAGVTLRFGPDAALITSDALFMVGTADAPIVLEPKNGVPQWAGVVVLQAQEQSTWRHVRVRDTNAITRGGWIITGGVTFYRTPVELFDCTFRDAHGEDALNIYGARFLLDRVTIEGTASDAFDGDFVTGTVRNSTFVRTVEDAVDVSGSTIEVIDCRFIEVGDKCISAGENSTARVRGGVVESASIAVASKDFSKVDVEGIRVEEVTNYALTAYIKKPEYGPSSIVARNLDIISVGRGVYLIQKPCTLELDGVAIAGTTVDVGKLYEQKILGQ